MFKEYIQKCIQAASNSDTPENIIIPINEIIKPHWPALKNFLYQEKVPYNDREDTDSTLCISALSLQEYEGKNEFLLQCKDMVTTEFYAQRLESRLKEALNDITKHLENYPWRPIKLANTFGFYHYMLSALDNIIIDKNPYGCQITFSTDLLAQSNLNHPVIVTLKEHLLKKRSEWDEIEPKKTINPLISLSSTREMAASSTFKQKEVNTCNKVSANFLKLFKKADENKKPTLEERSLLKKTT